ncbi:MAG: DUF87 domain-containing protein [Candidatus Bathyarchaeia archaeon]
MRLYRKEGDTLHILSFSEERAERGDYLLIEDPKERKSLLVQVLDIQFANPPGIMEDLLRETVAEDQTFGDDIDPLSLNSQIILLRDARLIVCKIRCSLEGGRLSTNISWLPSRSSSIIRVANTREVIEMIGSGGRHPIEVGVSKSGSEVEVDAEALDGGLSIIVGRKGTGKSHLSKLLLLGLIDYGAPCIVFDVNGEYVNLDRSRAGSGSHQRGRVTVLEACRDFKVTLGYVGSSVMLDILNHALGLPGNSARVFYQIWRHLEGRGLLTLEELGEAIEDWGCNESVREAIYSRYNTLVSSGFFTDDTTYTYTLEGTFGKMAQGGALVVNLSGLSGVVRRIVVEFMLGKLVELLKSWRLKAAFLFAEEAHLYLRETYWEDIVTRMRHLGLFTIFITNQPDSIPEDIYRQVDSIFVFNLRNGHDLDTVSTVAKIDEETMKLIASNLEPHHCLVVGQATRELPIVIKVKQLDVEAMGETRRFFA